MSRGKKRDITAMQTKLEMLQEGEHYMGTLEPAPKERTLFKSRDAEESDTDKSKQILSSLPISHRFQRDAMIDYNNPRQELSKFAKYVDQIPPFDHGPLTMFKPYDFDARQQVGLIIQGRSNYIMEEGKYDVTMENYKEKMQKRLGGGSAGSGQKDPPPTASEQRELARASLMETTSSL